MQREVATRKSNGSNVISTSSSMPTMPEDRTYISAEDDDYNPKDYEDDLADDIYRLSMADDKYSFDTTTTAFRHHCP
eukprot:10216168-Ditylum_brightwellii.AAC.1